MTEPWNDIELSRRFIRRFHSKKIEAFLIAFPQQKWSYSRLTRYVSLDFIAAHINQKWDKDILSDREDLTWEFIMKVNGQFSFDWTALSQHPNISFQLIKEKSSFPWYPEFVMRNRNVTYKDLNDPFFDKVKDRKFQLSFNPNIRVEDILSSLKSSTEYPRFHEFWTQLTARASLKTIYDTAEKFPWDPSELARRKDLHIRDVIDAIEALTGEALMGMCFPTQASILSGHPEISLALVDELKSDDERVCWSEGWNWNELSLCVPFHEILANPDRPWNFTSVSSRAEVTYQIMKDNPKVKWDVGIAVMAGNVRWEEFEDLPLDIPYDPETDVIVTEEAIVGYDPDPDSNDLSCEWKYMAVSPWVTWDVIKNNPHKPWIPECFSVNVNLTPEIIKTNPEVKWAWNAILRMHWLTSRPTLRLLVDRERENRRREILSELKKEDFLVCDLNKIVASYSDYE